jgi:hypothetical protein
MVDGEGSNGVKVELWLYGPLSCYGGKADRGSHAQLELELAPGTTVEEMLHQLGMPLVEKGITFINWKLSGMPGLAADLERELDDGDRVAIFHTNSMWPYQYRHGAPMTDELRAAMEQRDQGLHHKYN